ncbi:hypothetical protein BRD17_04910 [Halobacteriales archaeon SW_7_68_16]|nr:MAG: hypothetical protein BRD17_04910 [Halobacteriales archaeon SW_7_68_16]
MFDARTRGPDDGRVGVLGLAELRSRGDDTGRVARARALVAVPATRWLVWADIGTAAVGGWTVPAFGFGPWYYVHLAYSYLLVTAGIGLLVAIFLSSDRFYRLQTGVMILGALIPLAANAVTAFAPPLSPVPALNLTTAAFSGTGIVFAVALFRLRTFDLVPVARERILAGLDDGVAVVDDGNRVVDCNRTAAAVLDVSIGDRLDIDRIAGTVVGATVDGEQRSYSVSERPLRDPRGRPVGRQVTLRDITELEVVREHRQRLAVLHRVLRHNLRNDLGVVRGLSDTIRADADGQIAERAGDIGERVDEIVATAEKAQRIYEGVEGAHDGRYVSVAVEPVVERWRDRITSDHGVTVTTDLEPATVLVDATGDLDTALGNVVENAAVHGGDDPAVRVRVRTDGAETTITVHDDGPGIPEMELSALEDGESALEHGSGVGLWLVQWIVDNASGSIDLTHDDGTTVELTFPAGDPVSTGDGEPTEPTAPRADGPDHTVESDGGTNAGSATGSRNGSRTDP